MTTAAGTSYSLALLLAPRFGHGGIRELVNGAFEFRLEPGPYTLCNDIGECHSVTVATHAEAQVVFAVKAGGKP